MVLAAILVALVASCSSLPSGSGADIEKSLRQRVDAYWLAQQNGDTKTLRELVDTDLREALSQTIERMGKPNEMSRIVSWKIKALESDGTKASVHTSVTSLLRHPLLGPSEKLVESTVTTSWVRKKRTWFVVLEEPNLDKLLKKYEERLKHP